jgi:hypothetical protein
MKWRAAVKKTAGALALRTQSSGLQFMRKKQFRDYKRSIYINPGRLFARS